MDCYTRVQSFVMPRFFHVLEAERLLPAIELIVREIIERKHELDRSAGELNALLHQIAMAGGTVPPRARIAALRAQKQSAADALGVALEKLQSTGCLLKDADLGLVDFPTLYNGTEVYLCWKLGERAIGHWHHVEDGFRGRRPIDEEFLANHRGEA
jgi:hypothetical protein